MKSYKFTTIIVAGGSATRMNINKNKIFLKIDGNTIISIVVSKFIKYGNIVLVCKDSERDKIKECLKLDKVYNDGISFATAGSTRQESVYNGLSVVKDSDYVLVHDAARPYVHDSDIRNFLSELCKNDAALLCQNVNDTVKLSNESIFVESTIDRNKVYLAQTPQGAKYEILKYAHDYAAENHISATDDAALIEYIGKNVKIVVSKYKNSKITTVQDINMDNFKIGHGYDVHKLVEGRKLIICGVDIPHTKGLLGHSDADVAIHALMDSMLGAMALGDIGKLFPDNNLEYKDADSLELLKKVNNLINDRGYILNNCDISIVAQKPKLAPYINIMRENISRCLNIDMENISVKATTTEFLGFCGREEGISSYAVCTLKSMEV